ncbi:MAG TPA: CDC48 family AAA ATPase [Thermodesulfobacteriota bacterium]|nr:CDC48 family AAA ATPase [Thermodesulfobacteriota bacterium]
MSATIDLRVSETLTEDVGKGLARLDPEDIKALEGVLGDLVEISGEKKTVARITGTFPEHYGKKIIQIDGITRSNAEVNLGEIVRIKKIPYKIATTVLITPLDLANVVPEGSELEQFPKILQGLPVLIGDRINVPFLTGKDRFFIVEATSPSGGVLINSKTKFLIKKPDYLVEAPSHVSYEDVGGLGNELKLIREMVELPLRYVEVFEKLGVEAPKGVLIYGPPGTGKTLIARAIASETKLHFIRVNGPEIIHKFYGESEARLREIFEDATRNAPSIIFIDEIDAIAPKRAEVLGDVEKRVVAQLLALMDGMVSRGQVIVIGATNIPEMIDPALRRPGRFDREMALPVPNVEGRQAILRIHSRRMPLASDVDLERLAQITHAFVGADLEALCKEAGMVAVRRYLPLEGGNHLDAMLINPDHLEIRMEDFLTALREIEPSATREFYTERSKVQWHDIGGLKGIKETLLSIVDWPHKFPELFDEGKVVPPKGVLFSGPSGTGKTLMAKALAGETGLNFISISGPILFSKWLGESEKALHQIFKKAKQSAPCILFFDEIDALVTTRGDGSEGGAVERVASQFFNELDNLSDLSQVLVLGATNRKDLLDPALTRTGRLDYILNFPIPNEEERLEILRVHTKERPLADDVNLTDLAKRTSGMTGSHIAFVAKRAVMLAIGELIYNSGKSKTRKLSVTASHFEDALKEVQSREGLPHVEGS